MSEKALREAIEALVRDGRLAIRNGEIYLDDEPAADDSGMSVAYGGRTYRADGYSVETSHGCRRHIKVDQALDELRRGDSFAQEVAGEAYQWFCFDPPEPGQGLEAGSNAERREADKARFNSRVLARFLAPGGDAAMDFRLRKEDGNWLMPEHHAVVYAHQPYAGVAERWPDEYVDRLRGRASQMRRQAGLDWRWDGN